MLNKKWWSDAILDVVEMVFIGSAVFVIVYLFVGQLMVISGGSMDPTFKDKEQLIAEKITVKYKEIKRGEIIVFKEPINPTRKLIKRVIGLPGETIKFSNDQVYIDGYPITEPYLSNGVVTKGKKDKYIEDDVEYQIKPDSYVVLGDNRGESTDSRDFGAVSKDLLVGRVLLVYYPLTDFRFISIQPR